MGVLHEGSDSHEGGHNQPPWMGFLQIRAHDINHSEAAMRNQQHQDDRALPCRWLKWSLLIMLLGGVFCRSVAGGQNVVVVLDDSGSMDERMRRQRNTTKMEAAKSALLTVLETLPDDARVGVVLLNGQTRDGGSWVIPLGPVDKQNMREAIQSIRAEGSTPLGQFMKIGTDALLALREQEHYGTYRLLIVTDGEAGDRKLVNAYLPDIMSRGISVDVIGVDMAARHSLATQVNSYRSADDPESLVGAVREVFAETSGGADADESDFEMLAGFPLEVARAALIALSESGDHPIGEQPQRPRCTTEQPAREAVTPGGRPRRDQACR